MPADVKEVFLKSGLSKDPRHLNVYAFILDPAGDLVHAFHGVPGRGADRSDYHSEIATGLARLKLPEREAVEAERPVALPDLKGSVPGAPAGVRIFIRQERRRPVVEVVPVKAEDWKILSCPEAVKAIAAGSLRDWLVELYPPAIRTVDQVKPFQEITGTLELVPAGAGEPGRQALLRGKFHLAKGDEGQSAFEGILQAVITYRPDDPEVRSLRGFVEGDYLYRIRGTTQRLPLTAAIESRPE
jgi:hypothetical protein